jgi:hypothetical protein
LPFGGISSRQPGFVPSIHVFGISLEFRKMWMAGTSPAMTEHSVPSKCALEHDPENWEPVYRLFRAVPESPHHRRQVFIDVG